MGRRGSLGRTSRIGWVLAADHFHRGQKLSQTIAMKLSGRGPAVAEGLPR